MVSVWIVFNEYHNAPNGEVIDKVFPTRKEAYTYRDRTYAEFGRHIEEFAIVERRVSYPDPALALDIADQLC